MFSGIVEAPSSVLRAQKGEDTFQIWVQRPSFFDDLHVGDSVAVDGVCLTVEEFKAEDVLFCVAHETIQVTGWGADDLQGRVMNLERSLKMGDRIHGHFVSGHVDTTGTVVSVKKMESWIVDIAVDSFDPKFVWEKGSVTINGVSLTVNSVQNNVISVCLIPETLNRTNLQYLDVGTLVNIEYDTWAKAFVNYQKHAVKDSK